MRSCLIAFQWWEAHFFTWQLISWVGKSIYSRVLLHKKLRYSLQILLTNLSSASCTNIKQIYLHSCPKSPNSVLTLPNKHIWHGIICISPLLPWYPLLAHNIMSYSSSPSLVRQNIPVLSELMLPTMISRLNRKLDNSYNMAIFSLVCLLFSNRSYFL